MRHSSNSDSIKLLNSLLKQPIEVVVDVGVQYSTPFLMEGYPAAFHHLIEPVTLYHEPIRQNYQKAGIDFNLIEAAAADVDGVLYQHLQCLDEGKVVTHSQLLTAENNSLKGLIEIVKTPVVTLDALFPSLSNYLVKIDVDGIEEKIIRGGSQTIKNASVVIIEAPLGSLTSRVRLLEELGMRLFDITDMCYYFNQLQQVDLIFVNAAMVSGDLDFQPFAKHSPIVWSEWYKQGMSA